MNRQHNQGQNQNVEAIGYTNTTALPKTMKLVTTYSKSQNFGLGNSEFDELLSTLKKGDDSLFEKIFLSHFEDCILYLINKYSIEREYAYDITMDTLIFFRKKLLLGKIKYGNLRYLFTKMATQKLIKNSQKSRNIDLSVFYDDSVGNEENVYLALEIAWKALKSTDRTILKDFYYNKTSLISIAQKLGVGNASVRKKKQRSLEKLRELYYANYIKLERGK